MKKVFMLLVVAGFVSMTAVSCGDKAKEETTQEEGGDAEHGHEGGEEEHAH